MKTVFKHILMSFVFVVCVVIGTDMAFGEKGNKVIPVEVGMVCKRKISYKWRFVGRVASAKDVPVFPKVVW